METYSQVGIVNRYLGKPYKHHGRDDSGYDCFGIIIAIYRDLGYTIEDIYGDYESSRDWKESSLLIENYHKKFDKVDRPQLYDMVLLKNKRDLAVHIGVVIQNDCFIHCKSGTGVIMSRLYSNEYKNKIEGFYRLKELHGTA
jgi:cell wall-associated NlpC family hydrolase